MNDHTPGPWYVDGTDGIYSAGPGTEQHPLPAGVTWRVVGHGAIRGRRDEQEVRANARLIAAAPEMYDMLQRAVELLKIHRANLDEDEPIVRLLARISE